MGWGRCGFGNIVFYGESSIAKKYGRGEVLMVHTLTNAASGFYKNLIDIKYCIPIPKYVPVLI